MKKMRIVFGNLNSQIKDRKGWVMGHFMDENSPLKTQKCELKWGVHKKGEKKRGLGKNNQANSLAILIRGKVKMEFLGNKDVVLENEGDFVYWGPGVSHSWHVDEDCLVLTIRWPSLANDQVVEG